MGMVSGPAGCVCHFVWRGRLFLIIMMMIFISILIQYIIVENIHYGDYWWWWFFLWWWWWWWWWLIFRCAHTHILEKHVILTVHYTTWRYTALRHTVLLPKWNYTDTTLGWHMDTTMIQTHKIQTYKQTYTHVRMHTHSYILIRYIPWYNVTQQNKGKP